MGGLHVSERGDKRGNAGHKDPVAWARARGGEGVYGRRQAGHRDGGSGAGLRGGGGISRLTGLHRRSRRRPGCPERRRPLLLWQRADDERDVVQRPRQHPPGCGRPGGRRAPQHPGQAGRAHLQHRRPGGKVAGAATLALILTTTLPIRPSTHSSISGT